MGLIAYLIVIFFSGLIVGGLARLALPGRDPMTLLQTWATGTAGSFIAGLIGWALFGHGGAGILLSVVCAAAIVYAVRRSRGGSLTHPGRPPLRR